MVPMHPTLPLLLFPILIGGGSAVRSRPVRNKAEAKAIAEKHTGGLAVSAREIPLNGATGGWEVAVHMPGETRGWRCIVDSDSRSVHAKTRIPNPPRPKS